VGEPDENRAQSGSGRLQLWLAEGPHGTETTGADSEDDPNIGYVCAMTDEEAIGLAIEQAKASEAAGDIPIGAVVLIDGEVVAARHNERHITGDPTAHAEILALRDAAAHVGSWHLEEATLVVSLEPCTMCAGAAVNSRIGRIVFGAYDPKAGAVGTFYNIADDPRLNHQCEVRGGVRGEECGEMLTTFFAAQRG
jgi:tRNA(adenine34) deaminase